MKGFLLISILAGFVLSCSKPMEDVAFTDFKLQRVEKNSHFYEDKNMIQLKFFEKNIFEADVKLDTSLFVIDEGSYQNKLLGFYEDQIHKNSARVSYHTITNAANKYAFDSLIFKAYVYNDGIRNVKENPTLLCLSRNEVEEYLKYDRSIRFSIELTANKYIFKVDKGLNISVSRTSSAGIDEVKYLCYHYYGGPDSIPAPHDMDMWIRYSPIMK